MHDQEALTPELGPVLGKGDAMWRALHVLTGETSCASSTPTPSSSERISPAACSDRCCAGAGSRSLRASTVARSGLATSSLPDGGGRVTELTARPLLNLFYPELAAIRQPLAGEIAARRELLERLPFVTGYGVDVALLLDAYRSAGLDALAQVDLDVRQNAHQSLARPWTDGIRGPPSGGFATRARRATAGAAALRLRAPRRRAARGGRRPAGRAPTDRRPTRRGLSHAWSGIDWGKRNVSSGS